MDEFIIKARSNSISVDTDNWKENISRQ